MPNLQDLLFFDFFFQELLRVGSVQFSLFYLFSLAEEMIKMMPTTRELLRRTSLKDPSRPDRVGLLPALHAP